MDQDEAGALPEPQQPEQAETGRIRALPVIGGAVLGFGATWVLLIVAVLVLYTQYGDSSGTAQNVIAGLGLLGLPVLSGLLMIPRRTRHWGAGLVMGVAIGSISAAGVCGGFLGLNSL